MATHASSTISKVLVANRGEIAVRVIRAAKDAGLASVAVYAEPDADAPHVKLADEAFALGGQTSAESYLDFGKLLEAAQKSGANAIHPGYGFLAENADFAQAVIDAGLIWIGPTPAVDPRPRRQGHCPAHRRRGAGAAGPRHPRPGQGRRRGGRVRQGVRRADRDQGGVRRRRPGMKVARTSRRSPSCSSRRSARRSRRSAAANASSSATWTSRATSRRSASPTSTATSWSSAPATARCSAATRSSSKRRPRRSSATRSARSLRVRPRRICGEAGYSAPAPSNSWSARTALISFLEVNTRLQVEHPVTEETTGIDLVLRACSDRRRRAAGHHRRPDAARARHRVPDQRRGPGPRLLPAPGPVTSYEPPSGPGVRLDSGVEAGSVIGGQFDSLLAKLIVTGATAKRRSQRSRRALDEFHVDGLATVSRSTAPWCPTRRSSATTTASRCTPAGSRPSGTTRSNPSPAASPSTRTEPCRGRRSSWRSAAGGSRCRCRATWRWPTAQRRDAVGVIRKKPKPRKRGAHGGAAASGDAVTAPMQGTVVKVAVEEDKRSRPATWSWSWRR